IGRAFFFQGDQDRSAEGAARDAVNDKLAHVNTPWMVPWWFIGSVMIHWFLNNEDLCPPQLPSRTARATRASRRRPPCASFRHPPRPCVRSFDARVPLVCRRRRRPRTVPPLP